MTTDSTTGDLERRVARAIDPAPWIALDNKSPDIVNSPQRRMASLSKARAALKAHAEWLESTGLVVVARCSLEDLADNTAATWVGDQVRLMLDAAQQEDQHHD